MSSHESDFKPGDEVMVVNPAPTGALGIVIRDEGDRVLVRWTDHGYGQVGQEARPLKRLLRKAGE